MAGEAGTFQHRFRLTKWSAEQTAAAAESHGISSDELTHDHFLSLGFEPDEAIEVDHDAGVVTYTNRDGEEHHFSIDEWNAGER